MIARTMFRGDTLEIETQFLKSGIPVDLTSGYTIMFTAKYAVQDPDTSAVFQGSTTSSDVVITDAINGKCKLTMPAIKTIHFPDATTTIVYDFQAKQTATSKITTFEIGTIEVCADVTNSI